MEHDFIITSIGRVVLVGKNEYPQDTVSFSGPLKKHELIYLFSGISTVYFNGKELSTKPDTIRFLPKGEVREYTVVKKERGECIDICFDTNIPLSEEAFVINASNSKYIGNLFKKLFATWVAKDDGYYFECISLLYKIFAEMQKQNYIPKKQYDHIKPAIEYIEENFLGDRISVPYLAKICSISEAYLKKLFVKKFGVSPAKYIIQLKINHACDLLRSERYTITQAAGLCGYDNVYYFSRQFKEYMGITPTQFIKKYRSSK